MTVGGLDQLRIIVGLVDLIAALMYFLHADTVWLVELVVGGISIEGDMLGWAVVLISIR